jgi:mRNA interferase MazF
VVATRQLVVRQRDLGLPVGSVAGFIRPIVIIQSDEVNASLLSTYLSIPTTSNLRRGIFPTSQLLVANQTGLDHDSIAQATLTLAVAEEQLLERIGSVSDKQLHQLFQRLDMVIGR